MQAVDCSMANPGTVIGWKLTGHERILLLHRFEPKYENIVADHVTLRTGAISQTPLPHQPKSKIVGRADDGLGVECLVVELDGTTDRPDGSTYHITWSLGLTRTARESNDILREGKWEVLSQPIDITLEPALF